MLFSQIREKTQGHRCILEGPNPGLIIGDSDDFIPFVLEEQTQFCLFPLYPPLTSSARHADLYYIFILYESSQSPKVRQKLLKS
jgi:hypothetical protein